MKVSMVVCCKIHSMQHKYPSRHQKIKFIADLDLYCVWPNLQDVPSMFNTLREVPFKLAHFATLCAPSVKYAKRKVHLWLEVTVSVTVKISYRGECD